MMTQKEYLESGGLRCPRCQSSNISAGDTQVDGNSAWQQVDCADCGLSYLDVFNLAAYSMLGNTNTPSRAAKAAAILVFTSGIDDYDTAVKVYDEMEQNDHTTVNESLDKFPGVSRWLRTEEWDDSDWWSEVTNLADNIDKCRAHFKE